MKSKNYYQFIIRRLYFFLVLCLFSGMLHAQVSVTATGGTTTGSYTTLKASFDAINAGTHTGVINISITANTTETASAILNASGNAAASYTSVVIKPGAAATPTVSGNIVGSPLIGLNGASNVTIDGSNNNTTTRNLTFANTSTTTPIVIALGSAGTTPLTGDSIKNCTIINGVTTSSALVMGDAGAFPAAAPGYFNNITIRNNSIQKAYIGMFLLAAVSTNNGNNVLVTQNDVNSTGANAVRCIGIYLQGLSGATVSNNNIANMITTNAEFDRGIWLATGTTNTIVKGNTISDMAYTAAAGYAPIGISISPAVTNANITISENTITNISSVSTGTSVGILSFSAASGITIDKNKISNIKNTNVGGFGSAGILLASTLTASNTMVTNNFVWDVAAYGFNGYGSGDNGNGIVADGGGGYNVYYNTVVMNTDQTLTGGHRSSAFLATSNMLTASSINLKNNILVNLQTVGNGNSRLALSNNGVSTVFATMDNNDYYSTSTNLTSQGTNASITNTLAQVQTAFGSNASSLSIAPVFTSTSDLHLIPASNLTINNTGAVIAGVTADIDNEVRATTTPDIGADEYEYCPTVSLTTQPTPVVMCEGINASFTVAGTNANIFQWQVNTGSGFANVTNGGVYSGATTATLSLALPTAAMSGYVYRCLVRYATLCTPVTSNTALLTVNAKPVVLVTTSGSTSFCVGGSVTLSIPTGTNVSYSWTNGTTTVSTTNTYTSTITGTYTVTAQNTVSGCSATSLPVSVSVGPGPISVIAGAATRTLCPGDTLTLADANITAAGTTYLWQKNGGNIPGATNSSVKVTDTGYYTMNVNIGPGCATTSSPVHVIFNPLPNVALTPSSALMICQGSTDTIKAPPVSANTYQWYSGSSAISGALLSYYVTGTAGTYTVKVTSSTTGCKATSAPVVVTIVPLPLASVSPSAPSTACDSLVLTANNDVNITYQWRYNNTAIPGATNINYTATATGNYAVAIRNGNNCLKVSTAVPVTINPSPVATVTYNSPIAFCEGGAVSLNAYTQGGNTYQWFKSGVQISGATDFSYVATQTGPVAVLVTNSFGCTKFSPTIPVIVYPLPNPPITKQLGTRLSTGVYFSYQWFFNNVAIPGANDSVYWASQNGGYRVEVIDGNGCTNRSATVIVNNVGVAQVAGLADGMQLFPNPFKNMLTVKTENEKITGVELLSVTGAVVASQKTVMPVNEYTMNIADIANGIYMVRITTDKGVYTGKVRKVDE